MYKYKDFLGIDLDSLFGNIRKDEYNEEGEVDEVGEEVS